MDAGEEVADRRVFGLVEANAGRHRFQRKAHHDVGGREIAAGKPAAILPQCIGAVFQMHLQLRVGYGLLRLGGDLGHQRPQQSRHAFRHAQEHEFQQQKRHGRALGVMQPVGIGAARRIRARRRQAMARVIGIEQVFDDRAGLGIDMAVILDHRRLAEWMHLLQFGRGTHGGRVALVAFHRIGQAQLLEQPEHALRTGIVQVMDDDHVRFPQRNGARQVWQQGSHHCSRGEGASRLHPSRPRPPRAVRPRRVRLR